MTLNNGTSLNMGGGAVEVLDKGGMDPHETISVAFADPVLGVFSGACQCNGSRYTAGGNATAGADCARKHTGTHGGTY